MGPNPTTAIDPRKLYRNRIDILKRLGRKVRYGNHHNPDPAKYVVLSNGQLVKKETIRKGRLFVRGERVTLPDGE